MKLAASLLLVMLSLGPSRGLGQDQPPAYAWKAGAASVKITPEKPMFMAGYASRKTPSEGVEQDLFAKALALEDTTGKKQVFLTMDLIGIPADLRKAIEDAGREKFQLAPENIMMNASHTHCGPEYRIGVWRYLEGMEHKVAEATEYGEKLRQALITIMGEAIDKLEPAKVSYTHARCGVSMNRRLPTRLGFSNSQYPDGPVDQEVPIMEVLSADGKTMKAVMFGYACHNTTLSFMKFCGDYAGFAQEELQKAHPGAVALFVNGCSGDQNPQPRGKLELAQHHGKSLALAVEAGLLTPAKRPVQGPIKAAFEHADLAFSTPSTKEQLEEQLKSKNTYEADHAKRLLAIIANEGKLETSYPYPVQVIHFGNDIAMVTLGGEVVVDYSLRIKKELGKPAVWVAGYSNDVMGYIPSLRVLKEGGYEGGGAMIYGSHPGPWSDKVEKTIMGSVMKLNEELNGKK